MTPHTPCKSLIKKMVRAVRRGVKIRVISNYAEVIDTLNILGFYAKKWPASNLMHSKLVIIDNQIVVSGSHNFTGNAFTSNLETSNIFNDEKTAKTFSDFFKNLW